MMVGCPVENPMHVAMTSSSTTSRLNFCVRRGSAERIRDGHSYLPAAAASYAAVSLSGASGVCVRCMWLVRRVNFWSGALQFTF